MTKAQQIANLEKKNAQLIKLLEEERRTVAGYKELSRIQNAYIAVALKRMGATEENPVPIINDEITEAMDKLEVRALIGDGCEWKFFVEELKE